jgi:RimJ/RimL family protein N-acetyltransferase
MRHELLIEGVSHRLRPVVLDDAAFIAGLRSDPGLGRWIHPTANDPLAQRTWIAAYERRDGDVYFVVEARDAGRAEGLIGIYDIEQRSGGWRSAEWGRWILRSGSRAAVESAWLIYRAAFDRLGLDAVHCRTVADNAAVVSFHDSCGLSARRLLPRHVQLGGRWHDSVEHELLRADWPAVDQRLGALVQRLAQRPRGRLEAVHD